MMDYTSGWVSIFVLFPILMYFFIKLTLVFKKKQFTALFWFMIWLMAITNIIFVLLIILAIV